MAAGRAPSPPPRSRSCSLVRLRPDELMHDHDLTVLVDAQREAVRGDAEPPDFERAPGPVIGGAAGRTHRDSDEPAAGLLSVRHPPPQRREDDPRVPRDLGWQPEGRREPLDPDPEPQPG